VLRYGGIAAQDPGALAPSGSDFGCTGSAAPTAGITGSTDSSGALGEIYGRCLGNASFQSFRCDLGTLGGGDDNDGLRRYLAHSGCQYEYADVATFTCVSERCGTSSHYSIGDDRYSRSAAEYSGVFVVVGAGLAPHEEDFFLDPIVSGRLFEPKFVGLLVCWSVGLLVCEF
jgi:hypothetical protein